MTRLTDAPADTAPSHAPSHEQPRPSLLAGNRLAYLLIAPAVVAELLIHILPMMLGLWVAFTRLTQINIRNWTQAPFVGLDNFIAGLDPDGPIGSQLYTSFFRTTLYVIIVLGACWALGIASAVFLSSKVKGRAFLRTFFLIPWAMPAYVGTIAWAFMFNQRDGMVNKILVDDLGLLDERPFWLIGDNSFFVLVIASIWQMWPFAFLMLLAAMQSIPGDVFEAASLDGASLWRQFRSLILPMIRPTNIVLLLVMGLFLFNQFSIPYVLFGRNSPEPARLISPLIYEHSFVNWNFGLGSAVSALLLVVLFVASLFYIHLVMPRKNEDD